MSSTTSAEESPETFSSNTNNTSDPIDIPPEHLFSDYVEMVYLGLVILIGTSINIHVLLKLIKEKKKNANNKTMSGFLLLKINLNVSDLLILTIHAFGKLIWLYEYEWRFGGALCRIFNFLSMFTLYLSSNIVVCIAMDRLRTVLKAKRIILLKKKRHLIRIFLLAAWLLSFVWSLPQLYFWRTYDVFPSYPGGWIQCTDIWSIERYERFMDIRHEPSDNIFLSDFVQNLHDLTHLFFVFYGPLILLIVCYMFITVRLMRYAATKSVIGNGAMNASMASVNTVHIDPRCRYVPLRSSLSTSTTNSVNPVQRKLVHAEPYSPKAGQVVLQGNRRGSAFPLSARSPNYPSVIYEHPTSTANESEHNNPEDENGVNQLEKKRKVHRSFSSSDIINPDPTKSASVKAGAQSVPNHTKANKKSSSAAMSRKSSLPRKEGRFKRLVRKQFQECACASQSSADGDDTYPLDSASCSEVCNNECSGLRKAIEGKKSTCKKSSFAVPLFSAIRASSKRNTSLPCCTDNDEKVGSNLMQRAMAFPNRVRNSFSVRSGSTGVNQG